MPKITCLTALCFLFCCVQQSFGQYGENSQFEPFTADGIVHEIATSAWNAEARGNHRAIVDVTSSNFNAVRLILPWRRPDPEPELKKIVIIYARTGEEVKNVYIHRLNAEKGELAFDPSPGPGKYEIYYLPYHFKIRSDDARYGAPWNDYLAPEYHPDQGWLKEVRLHFKALPAARVLKFQARKKTDFFTSMGLPASPMEEQELIRHSKADFMIFPEDRAFPIRLTDRIPFKWARKAPVSVFKGTACRNEYYTLQLGVLASKKTLKDLKVNFSDLINAKDHYRISKDSLTCFNQEGKGWDGKDLHFKIQVKQGHVQPLWIGISVPLHVRPGRYTGRLSVLAENGKRQSVGLILDITSEVLADRGDDELWRHARLRWLNSTLGISDQPIAPYGPLTRSGNLLKAGQKQVKLNEYGLPQDISSQSGELLAAALSLSAMSAGEKLDFRPGQLSYIDQTGKITWNTIWSAPDVQISCLGTFEFDGTLRYRFSLKTSKIVSLSDLKLKAVFKKESVPYAMGIGLKGGNLPALPYVWDWKGPWDSIWLGSTDLGMHLEFEGDGYSGPLLNDYKPEPPAIWSNHHMGRISLEKGTVQEMVMTACTGPFELTDRQAVSFGLKILITPVKDINSRKHFSERYYQGDPLHIEKAAAEGANVINIHHNTTLNPYINYPFIVREALAGYIQKQHQASRKVKLYYTIRELSNHAPEIYALKSLGPEIIPSGPGKGSPWLWEHLNSGYKAAWYSPFKDQTADASVVINGFSRWINYYIEGLRWMLEHDKIDGLYLDDVAYDHEVIERLRRVLLKYNAQALIDLHSNNNYSIGPANQYASFFPYLDRIWFGESFKYNEMSPDEWLVQFSGIPFGVMGEMLQDDGNKWLGMVYGTSIRHSWGAGSPAALWKYWDQFNIKDARMLGYWDKECPVSSDKPEVKISVYAHHDKLLLAIGNFSDSIQYVRPQFRWPGPDTMNTSDLKIQSVNIEGFQEAKIFDPAQPIAVAPKKGWLLEVSKK
ncbi:hypothetical protein DBR11_08575 [Pedobacter sp. HMWF019]|uniref:glycoside hydrolase domain-containing protein n=1 Tax=Pedobacter sp. HMWF019 TaxID=2056856 RepID=UPI000D3C9863|nr:glycoside hydrolase domain-containing protein [Pedobacter sp. HMWF019]PTT00932.1 hypothetical protein DBR11_08575 [Pedobacter sp. HMWF019]